jgi:hypothetical protein
MLESAKMVSRLCISRPILNNIAPSYGNLSAVYLEKFARPPYIQHRQKKYLLISRSRGDHLMEKVSRLVSIPEVSSQSKITLDDLRRRWGKFDDLELAAITSSVDLVANIQAKYDLDSEQAQKKVDLWAQGRDFDL